MTPWQASSLVRGARAPRPRTAGETLLKWQVHAVVGGRPARSVVQVMLLTRHTSP